MKKLILGIFMTFALALGASNLAYAQTTDAARLEACKGVNSQVAGSNCATGGADLSNVIKGVLNLLSVIAGVAAVIMIIISGLRYITSAGDASAISGAKKTLIYAIVGLIVVAFAQFIVRFVLRTGQ